MTIKLLRLAGENKLENFGTTHDSNVIPRTGEFINILSNRFKVAQVEWFPMNEEVFVYLEDIPTITE